MSQLDIHRVVIAMLGRETISFHANHTTGYDQCLTVSTMIHMLPEETRMKQDIRQTNSKAIPRLKIPTLKGLTPTQDQISKVKNKS